MENEVIDLQLLLKWNWTQAKIPCQFGSSRIKLLGWLTHKKDAVYVGQPDMQ